MSNDYPFHTATVDGEEIAGVMFVAGTGRFYEFQDPDTHDDYARFECPRTGDVLTHSGPLDRALKTAIGGRVRGGVPAERWAAFRETYINAGDTDVEAWEAKFQEMHRERIEAV